MTNIFDHNAIAFSKKNMCYLAHCSNIAYDETHQQARLHLESTINFASNNFYFFIKKPDPLFDIQGFVIGDADKIIVSFCGSEKELADWWENSRINQVSWPAGQATLGAVHEGFWDSLTKVFDEVIEKIEQFRTNGQGVWLTGHSMGGALAILTAATISLENEDIVKGVYTFGQPRVGDKEFSSFYDSKLKQKTYRFVNYNDPVAEIPLEEQPLLTRFLNGTDEYKAYKHVGHYVWYNQSSSEFDCDCTPDLWDRVSGYLGDALTFLGITPSHGVDTLKGFKDFSLVRDHSMDIYETLAERVANEQIKVNGI